MKKLNLIFNQTGRTLEIQVIGLLDEDFVQSAYAIPTVDEVIFNLKELSGINSCGIREFISLLKRFDGKTIIYYENCPPHFVVQVNMVSGFISGVKRIKSLYVPYICLETDEEVIQFFEVKNLNYQAIPDSIVIDNKTYVIDGSIDRYFHFLKFSH